MDTMRGKLIEVISRDYCEENVFYSTDDIQKELQKALDENLKFQTTVGDVMLQDNMVFTNIYFKDENNIERAASLTVINKTDVVY